ncbi:hypothetical protein [Furfurilactobacillus milii]|uniref:Uncharacterized protein n=1 Tax=Furfurilactobacillus milii TaxID=2888272 RepID=A0ABT6DCC2_9LACO|nr:hypothetical protein [Furfurilactobacillus milii]QLE66915.1 hypothetical protein LROSL2_1565 [Furfurilactobacillus rossiae]MCF6161925.1 hypothetical protein [Furfurilactobacillus milii]MCF6164305.1 hypothetical protein [Furfurilactobacillus milii]MDF9914793.1 hypothetical protein [Furfurilactobacillus milii]QLE69345.1 hypothetical protein LROSL3_1566 [Furfurilactobacillus rossiae]
MKLAAYNELGELQGIFNFEDNYVIKSGELLTSILPVDDQHNLFDRDKQAWIIPTVKPTQEQQQIAQLSFSHMQDTSTIAGLQKQVSQLAFNQMTQDKSIGGTN